MHQNSINQFLFKCQPITYGRTEGQTDRLSKILTDLTSLTEFRQQMRSATCSQISISCVTDWRTDQRTDGRPVTPSYTDARVHLKSQMPNAFQLHGSFIRTRNLKLSLIVFVAGNASCKSPCRSVDRSVGWSIGPVTHCFFCVFKLFEGRKVQIWVFHGC